MGAQQANKIYLLNSHEHLIKIEASGSVPMTTGKGSHIIIIIMKKEENCQPIIPVVHYSSSPVQCL